MLKIAYHPIYKYALPDGHRFPMVKYELLPKYLLEQGICTKDNFFTPEKVSEAPILKIHTQDYYQRLIALDIDKKEIRKMGFPLRKELVERGHYIIDGTIKGCEFALEHGVAMNIAGLNQIIVVNIKVSCEYLLFGTPLNFLIDITVNA